MNIFFHLLRLVLPHWKRGLSAILLGFCTIGSNIGLMATSAYLISRAALHPPVLDLMVAIVGVRFFGISRAVFRYLERYLAHDVTFRILAQVRVWFYGAIEPLAPGKLMQNRSGDVLSHIVADVEVQKNFYLRVLAPPLVAFLVLLLMTIFLAQFETSLAYVYLLFFLTTGIFVPLAARRLGRRLGRGLVEAKARLNILLVDSLQGMTEIITFGQQQNQLTKVQQASNELLNLQGRMSNLAGLSSAITGLCMHVAMWSVLVLAITLINSGQLQSIFLAMLPLATLSSFEAVLAMPLVFPHLEEALTGAKRLHRMTSKKPAVFDPVLPAALPEEADIQVEDLSFRYEDAGDWALKKVNFKLPQGGKLAVVGPSGAGKSTLVNLLLRFWDFQDGSIRLADRRINEYAQEDLRKLIAVVSQRTHLFNTTIADNLLLAKPEASKEEMFRAAQRAKAHEFIQALPQGYDTYIGEGGFKLSGGQRQRLAIARALLKDAPILILDEATTGLDAVSERELLKDLYELMGGRTTLVITHRLAGLEAMDEIVVLNQGKVIEKGTHQGLLKGAGLYKKMWEQRRQMIE